MLIADDHPITRAGVRRVLEDHGFEVCAEAGDAPGAVKAAETAQPDICLLDINMPGSGIAAARQISGKAPQAAVVMLTASKAEDDFLDALRAGALGYLPKDRGLEQLPGALQGVLRGEAAIPPDLVPRVLSELRRHDRKRRIGLPGRVGVTLTAREAEVLDLLRQGLPTAEIARRLFLSRGTVRNHLSAAIQKLGAKDRGEALKLLDEGR